MNRDRSDAAEQPSADSSSAAYRLSASLIGGSLMLFLVAAMVDWSMGSEASRFTYAASAVLTLTAVVTMLLGIVLLLRHSQRLLGLGALTGGFVAVTGLFLEFALFFFGALLVERQALSVLTRALLVLEYPGEMLCHFLGIELIRHAYDVPTDRVLTEWPTLGAANLLAWSVFGVLVVWVGSKAAAR